MMQQHMLDDLKKPRTDDRPLWDLLAAARGYTVLLLAHDIKLFDLLGERPLTLSEICTALQVAPHPAEALLTTLEALRLVQTDNGHYALTPLAAETLLARSPTYFGWYLEREILNEPVFSFSSLRDAVRNNSPLEQRGDRQMFARAMHSMSMGAALGWPEAIDLSQCQLLLDIGGGSGAHSIGATVKWPNLRTLLFERDTEILQIAHEMIASYGLQKRVGVQVGDMLNDPFPPADTHLYSAIYHHWPSERCRMLAAKSFASLPSGGRIIIHERLYNEQQTGPFPVVALNMLARLRGEGGRYSAREYNSMLQDAGFIDLEVKPTFGYWSIVTGRKP
jgi:protein-L-isoaspartate O-methyltransferase